MNTHSAVYVIAGAAPPIFDVERLLEVLQRNGWKPCLILTPTAASWLRQSHGDEVLGCPVRVNPRQPEESEPLPPAAAVVAAPLTFNTMNKWSAGINDTLALGLLNELFGERLPIIAAPCVKATLRNHPAYVNSLTRLRECGVRFLQPEDVIIRRKDNLTLDWNRINGELESATNS